MNYLNLPLKEWIHTLVALLSQTISWLVVSCLLKELLSPSCLVTFCTSSCHHYMLSWFLTIWHQKLLAFNIYFLLQYVHLLHGHVICEVRNFRNHSLDTHVLLLQQTSEVSNWHVLVWWLGVDATFHKIIFGVYCRTLIIVWWCSGIGSVLFQYIFLQMSVLQ